MPKNVYLMTTGPAAGKSAIILGLMSVLEREIHDVGYFRPIPKPDLARSLPDPAVELVRSVFALKDDPQAMGGVDETTAIEMSSSGRYEDLLEQILSAYKRYEAGKQFVVIEGTDYKGSTTAIEFEVNAAIARNLAAPVLLLVSGQGRGAEEIFHTAIIAKEQLDERGCDLMGVIVNRVHAEQAAGITASLEARFAEAGVVFAGALPEEEILAHPRMEEVVRKLDASVLYGERYLDNLVHSCRIASMQLSNLLERLDPGALVIAAGDRVDVLLGMLCLQMSNRLPKLAGLILSSGLRPSPTIERLISGLHGVQLPVLAVESGTFETSVKVNQVASTITPTSYRKIETARILFDEHVHTDIIRAGISAVRSQRLTPKLFLHGLLERARAGRKRIVLPEGEEERILNAADILRRRDVVHLILLGREELVRSRAAMLKVDLSGIEIIDPASCDRLTRYAETYAELRKHKGVTLEQATDTMRDPTYFGTMMVYNGEADGMVSGSINTTAHTIRPAFEFIKTRPGSDLVSSVFFMCLPDRVLVYGDCAVNPNPTAEQLAQIATTSADTAAAFGIEPRVAMLSYATGESGSGADVDMVREATRLAQAARPDLAIDGPLQYDAAVDAGVAKTKLPASSVAGRATVFIFPDLNTGNNTYKAVQRSAGAIAVGPVLQGLRKPVNDLSRGCTVPDIVNTVAITAIQAQVVVEPAS